MANPLEAGQRVGSISVVPEAQNVIVSVAPLAEKVSVVGNRTVEPVVGGIKPSVAETPKGVGPTAPAAKERRPTPGKGI